VRVAAPAQRRHLRASVTGRPALGRLEEKVKEEEGRVGWRLLMEHIKRCKLVLRLPSRSLVCVCLCVCVCAQFLLTFMLLSALQQSSILHKSITILHFCSFFCLHSSVCVTVCACAFVTQKRAPMRRRPCRRAGSNLCEAYVVMMEIVRPLWR